MFKSSKNVILKFLIFDIKLSFSRPISNKPEKKIGIVEMLKNSNSIPNVEASKTIKMEIISFLLSKLNVFLFLSF